MEIGVFVTKVFILFISFVLVCNNYFSKILKRCVRLIEVED